jgi:hypothetical protein
MGRYVLLLVLWSLAMPAQSQKVSIQITSPKELKGRKAILLTREKGFAAIVHSIKLNSDHFTLDIANDLVPDLYQLHVSQLKGSLLFFLESGAKIQLDTMDVSKSVVTLSKSNPDWQLFQDSIQRPYDQRIDHYALGEKLARKERNADSLNYWVDKQALEKEDLVKRTGAFIANHLHSYVSLYLLKINWYALKNKHLFERLDAAMAGHRTYKRLKEIPSDSQGSKG